MEILKGASKFMLLKQKKNSNATETDNSNATETDILPQTIWLGIEEQI